MFDELLRVGIVFETVAGFEHATWVGLSPWENYPDRSRSALLGRWHSAVDDLAVPYLVPQENGGRGGVTETVLSRSDGAVIRTRHDRPLQFTAVHHTIDELEQATHWWKLPRRDTTVVHLDAAHRGVGTGCLGPNTRPAYRIRPGVFAWRWRLTHEVTG